MRIEILRNESYAYTTDNEMPPQVKADRITNQFRAKRLHLSAETEMALKVPRLGESDERRIDIESDRATGTHHEPSQYSSDFSDSEWEDNRAGPSHGKETSQRTWKRIQNINIGKKLGVEAL